MKLADYRDDYYTFSGKASDAARNLAFAGLGVVWIFRIGEGAASRFPRSLVFSIVFFGGALLLDLLHYTVGTIIWGAFARQKEKSGMTEESELTAPASLNWLTILFFTTKILAVLLGCCFLVYFILPALASAATASE